MENKTTENTPSFTLKHKIILILISIIGTLMVLEIGLRIYDVFKGRGFFSDYRNEIAEPMKPIIPFRTFGFDMYKEEDGQKFISSRFEELYPYEKPEGTFRIVCFGGSTTENSYQQKRTGKHYPILLQNMLREKFGRDNIEVINVGFSAYSTAHSLVVFELNVLDWKPDLVILSHNINDLTAMYWPGFSPDYANKYLDPFFNIPDYKDRYTLANTMFQHFKVYWEIKRDINKVKRHFEKQKPLNRKSYGDKPNPEFQKVFERNLASFASLGKENGIEVLFGSQPLCSEEEYFEDHFMEKPYNNVVVYPLHSEFINHHKAYNESMKKVAEKNGVWFVDNNEVMKDDTKYYIDSVHYTELGLEKLAENYCNFLLNKKIIKE